MKRGKIEIHNQLRSKYTKIPAPESNTNKLKVLIIEDHPLVQKELAKTLIKLNEEQEDYFFSMDMAFNCEEAFIYLNQNSSKYDIVVLDIKLTPYPPKKLFSGEDIAIWMKEHLHPIPKIIIVTYINDRQRIEDILKTLNPDGLIIKDDIACNTLLDAIKNTFETHPFYSNSVSTIARNLIYNNLNLEELDKQLLYELSCGSTTKELVELLCISVSSIQKRKSKLMDFFDIKTNSTRDLILTAKEKGFL